jgi:hypothetical protein
MIDVLNTICTGVIMLIVWFHTEAFIEYSKLFGISKLFKIDKFEKAYDSDFTLEYLPWIKSTYPNFFTRLINCPWCIGFWLTVLNCLFFSTIYLFPVIYVLTIVIYLIIVNKFFK